MIYYCPACEIEFDTPGPRDTLACPACNAELEERPRPSLCTHQYVRVGADEDGWVQKRCEKCGEFE